MDRQQKAGFHSNPLRGRPGRRLSAALDHYQPPETVVLMGTALLVGVGAGLGAVVFRWLIDRVHAAAFESLPAVLPFLGNWTLVLAPALGGLIVGPLIYFFAREAKGHGVPEVMEAVALRGGRIRPIVAVIKSLASSISIGSGGSVGREGPIVQIGSALGSTLGQVLHMSDERIRNLVACGAAGGIAATFNAPIAGVLFALEVILGQFSVRYFSTVVISSVTASVIGRIAFGNVPAFAVPTYALVSPWELVLYGLMGVLAAPVAVAFVRVLYWFEDLFDGWRGLPEYLKTPIGGALLGLSGLLFFQVNRGQGWDVPGNPVAFFGVGYEAMEWALLGRGTVLLLLGLTVIKILSTSLTIGSGGSGGVFAPSLFIGAMMGGAFGHISHGLFPDITAAPGAYALVGMAAVFAGAARAPITSILILFEMTDDYRIILPLMLATVISTILAEHLNRESVYTLKLVRRGVRLEQGRDIDVMQGVLVGEAMTTDVDTVSADLSLVELERVFAESHHHGFPVLDEHGDLFGIVTLQDLGRAAERGPLEGRTVRDIATRSLLTALSDEPMWVALKRLGTRDVGRLPVVERDNPRHLVGLIRRSDIVRAYRVGIARRLDLQERADKLRLGRLTGTEFIEIQVEPGSPQAGRLVRDLSLPEECLLTTARRGNKVILLHGDTRIQEGDRLIALADPGCAQTLVQAFRPTSERPGARQDSGLHG
ncbi:MAG: chloride channel protein [Anaerolineae bacterium]|nr:chloride channel protein [Anaerolineae bacterium]